MTRLPCADCGAPDAVTIHTYTAGGRVVQVWTCTVCGWRRALTDNRRPR